MRTEWEKSVMGDKATSNHNPEIKGLTAVELDDDQVDAIAGGKYIPETEQYICDNCGTMTEYLGMNHNGIVFFECPKCGRYYTTY